MFKPIETKIDFHGLVRIMVYIMERFVLYRGHKEITYITWSEVLFSEYDSGPDIGNNLVQLVSDEDKTHKRTMKNPSIDLDKRLKKLRESLSDPSHDPFDTYRIFLYYRSTCPDEQISLFCGYQSKSQAALRLSYPVPAIQAHCTNSNRLVDRNSIG